MPKMIVIPEEHKQNFKPLNFEFVENRMLSAVGSGLCSYFC